MVTVLGGGGTDVRPREARWRSRELVPRGHTINKTEMVLKLPNDMMTTRTTTQAY